MLERCQWSGIMSRDRYGSLIRVWHPLGVPPDAGGRRFSKMVIAIRGGEIWNNNFFFDSTRRVDLPAVTKSKSEIGWRRSISLIWMLRVLKSEAKGSKAWRRIGMLWRFCAIGFYVFWKNNYFFICNINNERMRSEGTYMKSHDAWWISRDALLSGVILKSNAIRCRRRRIVMESIAIRWCCRWV